MPKRCLEHSVACTFPCAASISSTIQQAEDMIAPKIKQNAAK